MKTLSKITPQKKRKDRYNIFLDGKYSFSVSLEVKEKYRLRKGISIDGKMEEEIVVSETFEKVYDKIINFISYRSRSQKEIEGRLAKYLYKDVKEKKYRKGIRDKIIERLGRHGLIDDEKFVKEYVDVAKRSKKNTGKLKVRDFLYKKGISRELIDEYVDRYDDGSEADKALKAAKKKLRLLGNKRDFKTRNKVYRFLYGRGFTLKAIKSAVDTLFEVQ